MKLTISVIEFKLYLIAYAKKFREKMKESNYGNGKMVKYLIERS